MCWSGFAIFRNIAVKVCKFANIFCNIAMKVCKFAGFFFAEVAGFLLMKLLKLLWGRSK